jgi:hypothetical protein
MMIIGEAQQSMMSRQGGMGGQNFWDQTAAQKVIERCYHKVLIANLISHILLSH